jgi:selenocysteine-specific elongation factor
MPFVIGTAGHIDHGKTTLVKALTGQDTDRLKEEKERGISIDLGFAHLDLPDGSRAGVVDVPGHERFIRNMLAGAHGIDLVLFTVAADDGVMPQTEEHLDIVHLLGVQRAVFVMTKVDLVREPRLHEVEEQIGILTQESALAGSPIVRFSAVTSEGLDEIRAHIVRILRDVVQRRIQGHFRLPVDRAFVMPGHGLVVTGTALSGEVRMGDRVRCLPGDHLLRVRSLQVHGEPVDVARWGQRVALNLSALEKVPIERGHVICDEDITTSSSRFDAFVELVRLPPSRAARASASLAEASGGSGKPDTTSIKSHQRVRVHLGTAERLGRLVVLGARRSVEPKDSAYCQIALSEPLLTMRGDRFVLRDETAQRTIGGGIVVHPWARRHKRGEPGLTEALRALHASLHDGDDASALLVVLTESDDFAVPIAPLRHFVGLGEADTHARLERLAGVRVLTLEGERLYTTDLKWQRVTDRLLDRLRDFHAARPLAPGMEMEAARDGLPGGIAPRVFRAVVDRLDSDRIIAREGSLLRLPGHSVHLKSDEQAVVERITALLDKTPLTPPDVKQLEVESGLARAELAEVLRVMARENTIVRASPELYFLRKVIDRVKATLRQRWASRSEVTPAAFRDLFETSRKYAIPLLELLDREGVTVRIGNTRHMR